MNLKQDKNNFTSLLIMKVTTRNPLKKTNNWYGFMEKLETYAFISHKTLKNSFPVHFWAFLPPKPQHKDFVKTILPNFQPLCYCNFMQEN